MTKTDIGIYRGLKEKFNPEVHVGFFITTDTGELLIGDQSLGQTISAWEINDGVLTLTLNTGKEIVVTFPEATETVKGLLSAADKAQLLALQTNLDSKVDKVTADNMMEDIAEIQNTLYLPYKAIDLGLPSGTLWADRNIGATDIYDGGKLFQWGDPTPYDAPEYTGSTINEGQKKFGMNDYKWSENGTSTMTKYNKTDGKLTLDPEDDAAHVNMGGTWKMPTKEQVIELFKETTQELYAKLTDGSDPVKVANGVYNENDGYVYWNYIDGHTSGEANHKFTYMKLLSLKNGNFLVIPFSVAANNGHIGLEHDGGNFWSSSLNSGGDNYAWYSFFNNYNYGVSLHYDRPIGIGVRGVTTSTKKVSRLDEIEKSAQDWDNTKDSLTPNFAITLLTDNEEAFNISILGSARKLPSGYYYNQGIDLYGGWDIDTINNEIEN